MTLALGLLAIALGWYTIIQITCYITRMHTAKIAGVAALGACLPFIPELLALLSLPAPVANALCAAILAGAYVIIPKGTPAK
jgi:hypothetical protein